ncbi:MAG: TraR/DksA C4-type zinc finger protein [Pseudomonadota bacterium]
MDIKNAEYFKQMLMDRLNELLLQAEKTISEFMEQTTREIEHIDQASVGADQEFKLRIRTRENKLIKKVREALTRLEDGTYGICEYCGEDIPLKRLEARPVTAKCIACKEEEEKVEWAFK